MAIAVENKFTIAFLIISLFLTIQFVLAADYKINIETLKEVYDAGENIGIKVVIYDSENKLINDEVTVILEDSEKTVKKEQIISSNILSYIKLENARFGTGTITAIYENSEATALFNIGIEELAKFEIKEDQLIITNVGNTKYAKTVNIIIGDTASVKYPKLNVGESISYRLVAPDGTYLIKVYDDKTTLTQGEVKLSGTGKVIGAIDESASTSGITGGIKPEENNDFYGYLKSNKFTYAFVLVIFGAMILLAIERRYRKKVNQ